MKKFKNIDDVFEENRLLKNRIEELEKLVSIDELTNILNRRGFFYEFDKVFARYLRKELEFTLCIIDLNEFKSINDKLGHIEGDKVLKTFSNVISSNIRKEDIFGRIGGDEFCLVFINTDKIKTISIIEKIKHKLKEIDTKIIFSTGVIECNKETSFSNRNEVISKADTLMYKSKELRNGLVIF